MKLPDHTVTVSEPVVCVKPGRTLLLRLCFTLVIVIGAPAVAILIWAEVTSFNLNTLPWLPRIGLAAAVGLAAYGIYQSIQERQTQLELRFYRDRLVLSYGAKPSLWSENAPTQQTEIRYADVRYCVFSLRRCRVTLVTKGYLRSVGDSGAQKKSGSVSFSTLGAPDTDFTSLLKKHSPMKVIVKN